MQQSFIPVWSSALKSGWHATQKITIPFSGSAYTRVVIVGMGGSGIAGHLLRSMSMKYGWLPIEVVDGPSIPPYCGDESLYVVCSYSGNTWEALAAYQQIVVSGYAVVALTSGGYLATQAAHNKSALIALPAGQVPRETLPWFMGSLFALLAQLGHETAQLIDSLSALWLAYGQRIQEKKIAEPFMHHLGNAQTCHVWGVRGDTDALAYRVQTQLNENSKVAAVSATFPELNHNLLVGFTPTGPHAPILLLMTSFCDPRLKKAVESLTEVLAARGIALYKPPLLGDNWLHQVVCGLWWADSVSYYIGYARGHAIAATVLIDQLKQTFSKKVVTHEEEPSS